MLRPARILGADPHLAPDQRAEGGLNVGPLFNLLSDSSRLFSSEVTGRRFRVWSPDGRTEGSVWRQSPALEFTPGLRQAWGHLHYGFPVLWHRAGSAQ